MYNIHLNGIDIGKKKYFSCKLVIYFVLVIIVNYFSTKKNSAYKAMMYNYCMVHYNDKHFVVYSYLHLKKNTIKIIICCRITINYTLILRFIELYN